MTTPTDGPTPRHLDQSFHVTCPTPLTLFWRTFIPYQLWRFAEINLRMIHLIAVSHRSRPGS